MPGTADMMLEVVTPAGRVVRERATAVTAISEIGEIRILPGHRPLLTALAPGRLAVNRSGDVANYAVDRGFLAAGPAHVSIITRRCVAAAAIDPAEAERGIADLDARFAAVSGYDPARASVEEDLVWARALLAATVIDH